MKGLEMKIYSLFRLILLTVCLSSVLFLNGCISGCELDFAHGCPEEGRRDQVNSIKGYERSLERSRKRLEEGKVPPERIEYEKDRLRQGEERLKKLKEEYNIK